MPHITDLPSHSCHRGPAIPDFDAMGGKQWAKEEELVFWKFVVPKSPKRVGGDRQNREMSWKDCAAWMQRRMAKVYKEPRRTYTELCLCESSFRCLKPVRELIRTS